MRPILYDVDPVRGELTILLPGRPHRLATVPLRPAPGDPTEAARRQFAALTAPELAELWPTRP